MEIVWKDLDKKLGLFTKRNAMLMDLDENKPKMHYGVNTKINFVQSAVVNDELYLRTESAKQKGLNLAIKASYFDLPKELAPSVPPSFTSHALESPKVASRTETKNKNLSKIDKDHKDGGGSVKKLFKRLFKKGK